MTGAVAIIAGGTALPAYAIAAVHQRGRQCIVFAIKGMADHPAIEREKHFWVRVGEGGKIESLCKEHGVTDIAVVGKFRRPSLAQMMPDARTARFLARVAMRSLGDDGLMRAILKEAEASGFRILGQDELLADLLAPEGVIGKHAPLADDEEDFVRGFELCRGIGRLDIGQCIVVQDGNVLAVEAADGTDATVDRAGRLRPEGRGGVLVKLRKPQQERRIDLPVLGVATVEHVGRAGLAGIVIEAGATLIVDRDAVAAAADRLGLFVQARRIDA
ncbi:MAG: LpxI family protein [Alphaproteobacteria bacterium]